MTTENLDTRAPVHLKNSSEPWTILSTAGDGVRICRLEGYVYLFKTVRRDEIFQERTA